MSRFAETAAAARPSDLSRGEVERSRRAEDALRESEERFRLAAEAMGGAVYEWDLATDVVRRTGGLFEVVGYGPDEVPATGRWWGGLMHPDDQGQCARRYDEAIARRASGVRTEYRVRHRDGRYVWVWDHGRFVYGDDGRPSKVVGCAIPIDDRKRAEEAARESRAMLRTVLDNIPQGVFWKDRDSVYLGMNAAAAHSAGFARPEEVIGTTDLDLPGVTPEQAAFFRRKDREVVESGRPQHGILEPITRADGSTAWLSTNKLPLTDADGEVIGVLGTSEDVTERRRAEETVRESEAWLRTITDSLPVLVSYIDTELRYRFANKAYLDWFGLDPSQMVGMTIPEALGEETFAHRRGYLDAALRGERVCFEGPLVHRLLGRRDAEVTYTPDVGPAGEVRGFFVLVHDVTDRKQAEERHRDAEEQFRTLADSIPHLAWMARPDGHIFWYNRRWYEYTGTTLAEMEGWGWQRVHDPAELERMLPRWKAAIESGAPWEDTFPLRRHDGTMRWHLSRAMPVRDAEGRIVRWFGTNTDISEQRELENALREANRRKDEFLATLGHELRNPLASIVNAAEAMAFEAGAESGDGEMIEIVERQARHMSRLIDDLLDVARIARGKILLRTERLDLAELVRQTAEDHRREVEDAGLVLAVKVMNRPLWVEGDRTRLDQVLGNLLHNAVKFTDVAGTIAVTVALEEGAAAVRVRDTGLGMTDEMLGRVFLPFSQADASLARSRGGLGLGLALVRGLVELHGGAVAAASEGLGRGTEFSFRLPLVHGPAAESVKGVPRPSAAARLRIVAIDDRRDVLRPLQVLLKGEGHEVAVAATGRAGIEKTRELRPDVVICDIGLPGEMNGHDVARALRTDPETASVRLIALTGYGQESDRQAALAAGFDLHLTKPVDIRVLRSVLGGVMPVPR